MQSKKDEVKQEIESAALKVFFRKGFSDAKMNDIADEIQISVGNIYTYFKNKKELFYSVVPPSLVDYLKNVLVENIRIDNQTFFDDVNNEKKSAIVQEQINILTQYSRQIVIIFEKNKGTVYSNAKNELIDLMIETKRPYIKDHYKRYEIGTEENMILLKIIANNVINMILDLLKHEMSADSRRRIFEALSLYWLHGLKSLNE
ncbi:MULTISPECIES: TetR/AcrR family transcriptional regulator [Paenibacillus]|uniref:TetR/AcrR family transcriptional regulator n=1 Tax=Paenibacillus TaxID=44249 RepID=UPI0004F62FA4|nr:TetR/AcrR family transcriptional regulator [Paenibacillus odorifer]AIQ74536.1 transcriptional regulator [Paenibacillus odorifer]OME62477.1 TetR family transcriptional regulator [Paenibacillus odorifer]OZQ79740.1 TetR family transcriptional regulator [Paenibacillus odorifer]